MKYPKTPTLDAMKEVHEKSQAIGEFIDVFLAEKGFSIGHERMNLIYFRLNFYAEYDFQGFPIGQPTESHDFCAPKCEVETYDVALGGGISLSKRGGEMNNKECPSCKMIFDTCPLGQ